MAPPFGAGPFAYGLLTYGEYRVYNGTCSRHPLGLQRSVHQSDRRNRPYRVPDHGTAPCDGPHHGAGVSSDYRPEQASDSTEGSGLDGAQRDHRHFRIQSVLYLRHSVDGHGYGGGAAVSDAQPGDVVQRAVSGGAFYAPQGAVSVAEPAGLRSGQRSGRWLYRQPAGPCPGPVGCGVLHVLQYSGGHKAEAVQLFYKRPVSLRLRGGLLLAVCAAAGRDSRNAGHRGLGYSVPAPVRRAGPMLLGALLLAV